MTIADASATALFDVALADNTFCGGTILATIFDTDSDNAGYAAIAADAWVTLALSATDANTVLAATADNTPAAPAAKPSSAYTVGKKPTTANHCDEYTANVSATSQGPGLLSVRAKRCGHVWLALPCAGVGD